MHRFEKLKNISSDIIELNFYQDQNKWKHILIPIENSKNASERIVDLSIYKNHYVFLKKLQVFLGNNNKSFICRRCLIFYTNEKLLIMHKPKCENDDITTISTSEEPHLR